MPGPQGVLAEHCPGRHTASPGLPFIAMRLLAHTHTPINPHDGKEKIMHQTRQHSSIDPWYGSDDHVAFM